MTSRVPKFPIGPILESFGAYVGQYKTGRMKVLCPFHGDTRPSASVDFVKQRFVCFSCGVSGDALDLLRTQEGLSWDAAIARAEALTGGGGPAVREKPTEDPGLFARPRTGGRR